MAEPHTEHPGSDPDRVSVDVAELAELTAAGIEVDGEIEVAESTWIIYGHTSYDSEVVVGEYHDAREASEVLRATERRGPEDDRPVP
jgi:hypothetical protein